MIETKQNLIPIETCRRAKIQIEWQVTKFNQFVVSQVKGQKRIFVLQVQ